MYRLVIRLVLLEVLVFGRVVDLDIGSHVLEQGVGQEVIFLQLNLVLDGRRFVQFALVCFLGQNLDAHHLLGELPFIRASRRHADLLRQRVN